MPTMKDVAELAGVSAKTVSRVFNNDRYISDDVRGRVEAAIAELGYVMDTAARTLRSGRDKAIGVAVPDLADPFFAGVVRGIESAARQHDTAVLVSSLGDTAERERAAVQALLGRRVAGLIVAPTGGDQSYLRPWARQLPLVFVDRPADTVKADSVISDDETAAAAAVQRLLDAGHRRIAVARPDLDVVTVQRRLRGYRAALSAAGLSTEPSLQLAIGPDLEATRTAVTDLLAQTPPPTALFAASSRVAVDVVAVTHELDRTDLAIVSFGDFDMAAALRPSITAIDQRPIELGRAAAERIFHRLDKPGSRLRRNILFELSIIERQSSRLAPVLAHRPRTTERASTTGRSNHQRSIDQPTKQRTSQQRSSKGRKRA